MKAAFAAWDDRIAPVFDVARRIHLVEAEGGQLVRETREVLADDLPVHNDLRLAEMGAGTLVCGAISRPFHEMIAAYGIRVIPFVAGDLREVIQAWLTDSLDGEVFAMPGCCGRGGRGRGQSRGRRRGGPAIGRAGGPRALSLRETRRGEKTGTAWARRPAGSSNSSWPTPGR